MPSIVVAVLTLLFCVGCEEKDDSGLGSSMVDPATVYSGICDTIFLDGYTVYDDSLMTSDYSEALIGRYDDPDLGTSWASLFAQVALSSDNGISISNQTSIDSVEIRLVLNNVFSTASGTSHTAHIRVYQLLQPFGENDYYGSDSIACNVETCLLDSSFTVDNDTRSLRLRMNRNMVDLIDPILRGSESSAFLSTMKGIRIDLNEAESDDLMLEVNMNAVDTKITLYCSDGSKATSTYDFILGHKSGLSTRHFVHFRHNYAGTPIARYDSPAEHGDTIGGASETYLKPMGGTRVVYKIDTAWLNNFIRENPYSVINYAELILPVVSGDSSTLPRRILAYKGDGLDAALVSDATDANRYSGFDGYFNSEKKYYRMRIVRHLQQIVTEGTDAGTTVAIDARRSSPQSAFLKGSSQSDRPRIVLVYSD